MTEEVVFELGFLYEWGFYFGFQSPHQDCNMNLRMLNLYIYLHLCILQILCTVGQKNK